MYINFHNKLMHVMNRHAPVKVLGNKEVKEKQINHGKIKKLVKI